MTERGIGTRIRGRLWRTFDHLAPEPTDRLAAAAARYWSAGEGTRWAADSHWRSGIPGEWESVGQEHLALFDRLARVLDTPPPFGTVIEWGAGGGANAVAFAPRADEFVAVDIVEASLAECARQVEAACTTPVRTVLADPDEPEATAARIGDGSCDLFLCLYVLEALPTAEHGMRVLRAAHRLLRPGGAAFIQFKYPPETGGRRPRRGYVRNLPRMVTYTVEGMWTAAQQIGFTPQTAHLVPRNALDSRYVYLLLTR